MTLKKWISPELVVLVRGESEENVLKVCKNGDSHSGPDGYNCHIIEGDRHSHCNRCDSMECS